jgi:DNA-binding IclR family transcriptional regulator
MVEKLRRYGNHPEISYRKLSEASGVNPDTIMRYVKILQEMEDETEV